MITPIKEEVKSKLSYVLEYLGLPSHCEQFVNWNGVISINDFIIHSTKGALDLPIKPLFPARFKASMRMLEACIKGIVSKQHFEVVHSRFSCLASDFDCDVKRQLIRSNNILIGKETTEEDYTFAKTLVEGLGTITPYQWRNFGGTHTCASGRNSDPIPNSVNILYYAPDGSWIGYDIKRGIDQFGILLDSLMKRKQCLPVLNYNPATMEQAAFTSPCKFFSCSVVEEDKLAMTVNITDCSLEDCVDEIHMYYILSELLMMYAGLRKHYVQFICSGIAVSDAEHVEKMYVSAKHKTENVKAYNLFFAPEYSNVPTDFSYDHVELVTENLKPNEHN